MKSFGAMHVPALRRRQSAGLALFPSRATRGCQPHGAVAGGFAGSTGGLPVLLSRLLGLAFAAVTVWGLVFYVMVAIARA